MRIHLLALRREPDAASRPLEQWEIDLQLELVNRVRNGGLADVQGLRRSPNAAVLGNGRKDTQMVQVHPGECMQAMDVS